MVYYDSISLGTLLVTRRWVKFVLHAEIHCSKQQLRAGHRPFEVDNDQVLAAAVDLLVIVPVVLGLV